MGIGKCSRCGAKIRWIITPSGKNMPCEVSPELYIAVEGGKQRIVTPSGEVIACGLTNDPEMATGHGFIPHWGNCGR